MSDLAETYGNILKSMEASRLNGKDLLGFMEIKLQELKVKVDNIFNSYENERVCPNLKNGSNCGVLEQKVIDCSTCNHQTLLCVGGTNENKCDEMVAKCPMCVCIDGSCFHKKTKKKCNACPGYFNCLNEVLKCSTHQIEIHEGEDLAFECNFKFLGNIEEEIEYVYDKRHNFQIHPLKTGSKSNYAKPFATSQDSGHYTCTARSKESKFPFAREDFIVKVKSESGSRSMDVPDPAFAPKVANGGINEEDKEDPFEFTIMIVAMAATVIVISIFAIILIVYIKVKRAPNNTEENEFGNV
ncbi:uncharacterized protein LOC108696643 isoform X2 [Xenopus laevis]|nr:uncharacterized protein LOC108696643 isoform X2 [Xenopus laevis]